MTTLCLLDHDQEERDKVQDMLFGEFDLLMYKSSHALVKDICNRRIKPDILMIEMINTTGMSGLDVLKYLNSLNLLDDVKVFIYSSFQDCPALASRHSATHIDKSVSKEELLAALKTT